MTTVYTEKKTLENDGYHYASVDFDVMTNNGEKHYATITLKIRLIPEVLQGKVVWVYDTDRAIDDVFKIVPSKRNRKDVRIIPCHENNQIHIK